MNIHDADGDDNFSVERVGAEVHVELVYPNVATESQCRYVFVNQQSSRASDGVRLHYDYARDGFVIEQASRFRWDADDPICDPCWQEVAFVASWARDEDA